MKNPKAISCLLAATIVATSVAACSKDTDTTETTTLQTNSEGDALIDNYAETVPSEEENVTATTPAPVTFTDSSAWFTVNETNFEGNPDAEYQLLGSYGERLAVGKTTWEYYDGDVFAHAELVMYSIDGTILDSIDLNETLSPLVEEFDLTHECAYLCDGCGYTADNVLYLNIFAEKNEEGYPIDCWILLKYDMESLEIISTETLDAPYVSGGTSYPQYTDFGIRSSNDVSAEIYITQSTGNAVRYGLDISSSDGRNGFVELEGDLMYIMTMAHKDADTLFVVAMNPLGEAEYYEIDLNTMESSYKTEEYFWIPDSIMYRCLYSNPDSGIWYTDGQSGVDRLNFEESCVERIVNFSYCNVNRSRLTNSIIVACDETSVTLATDLLDYSDEFDPYNGFSLEYWSGVPQLTTFTIDESNPYSDRTILTAVSLNGFDYSMYESIYQFNNSSSDYFIVIDYSYDTKYMDELSDAVYISDELAVDLISGDGPDIIFNAMEFSQLNSSDYLVDVMEYVNDPSLYYTNIFEGCATDGALYQVPLTYILQCIATTSDTIRDDQVGFTFEEYQQFISDACNGYNPIDMDTMDTLALLYSTIANECITNGVANLNNPAFIALAEYMKDEYVEPEFPAPELIDSDLDGHAVGDLALGDLTYYRGAQAFGYYGRIYADDIANARILGLPSYDGRGAQFEVRSSVAVSANSDGIDGCIAYVQFLIGDEMQLEALNGSSFFAGRVNPVNRAAFAAMANQVVSEHNAEVERNLAYCTPEEIISYGISHSYINQSDIDRYSEVIENCQTNFQIDAPVLLIIREEIQAYFAGQRDIDTTIDVMENRINTYLQER